MKVFNSFTEAIVNRDDGQEVFGVTDPDPRRGTLYVVSHDEVTACWMAYRFWGASVHRLRGDAVFACIQTATMKLDGCGVLLSDG